MITLYKDIRGGAHMKSVMTVTPSIKYKIQDADEMQLFMHMKRKGASTTKNKKAYARHGKHKGRGYNY